MCKIDPSCLASKEAHCPECFSREKCVAYELTRILAAHRSHIHGVPGTSVTTRYRRERSGRIPKRARALDLGDIELLRRRLSGSITNWAVEFRTDSESIIDALEVLSSQRFRKPKTPVVDVSEICMTGGVLISDGRAGTPTNRIGKLR